MLKRSIILKRACVNFILFDSKLVCKRIFKKFVRELNRKYYFDIQF